MKLTLNNFSLNDVLEI